MKVSVVLAAFAATATALPFNIERLLGARTTVATPPEGVFPPMYPPPTNGTAEEGLKKRTVMTPPVNSTAPEEITLKKRTMVVPQNYTEPTNP